MIILASNGLSSPPLLEAAGRCVRPGKAALVVTADNVYKERNYHVERAAGELERLGMTVECFDFDTQSPDALLDYDLAEMIGGNPYYLLRSIRLRGFADALREFAENRVLTGWSAGALVIGPTLELIDRYAPEMNGAGLTDLSALGLTDVQILPHYSRFLTRYENFEETCARYEREKRCRVIRINDGEGVLIRDGRPDVIHI
ncbi:MAG: type 1 glutamine amidotransferase-like domain-containing protein [Oscillibacter sp.]|nr:type 1 glutamine amidotransferase-like domain-containing protein [Oscillibacter sp.]